MVISKCVPMEISRKKFSQFQECNPEEMIFVGYKTDEDGKKVNAKVDIGNLLGYIKESLKELDQDQVGNVNEVKFHKVENGRGPYWDENERLHIIDLGHELGAVEINTGGDYTNEMIYFINPIIGTVTNVVVDNTGLPVENDLYERPVEDFHLYYGSKDFEILTVPPYNKGIVQILHSKSTDIIICSTYSPDQEYIPDQEIKIENDSTGNVTQVFPDENYDVEMNNEKAYLEFKPDGKDSYTFWFNNPELGSMTYIVINNKDDYQKNVQISYGKRMDKNDPSDDVSYLAATVEKELCVIEVFHSLSADILVKITKV